MPRERDDRDDDSDGGYDDRARRRGRDDGEDSRDRDERTRGRGRRDEDGDDRPAKKGGSLLWLWLTLGGVGLLVLVGCGGGILWFMANVKDAAERARVSQQQRESEKQKWTLPEVERQTLGKSADAVTAILGNPDDAPLVKVDGEMRPRMYFYRNKLFNSHKQDYDHLYLHFDTSRTPAHVRKASLSDFDD